jgi:methylthioribose-1-phosphate isomerase
MNLLAAVKFDLASLNLRDEALLSPLRWEAEARELLLVDQLQLPHHEVWLRYRDSAGVAEAIRKMIVRGAPAIGIAAAYGVALAALGDEDLDTAIATLRATRPTAKNLFWALDRMHRVIATHKGAATTLATALVAEAQEIHREDVEMCLRIGEYGGSLLPPGAVLTHCNAGGLATGGYGTAVGVIRSAIASGTALRVFADETRPYLQGARLTAFEFVKLGIPVTLLTESMAGHLMSRGEIQSIVVGADRIARNGDAANKIGTYTLAVLAHAHGIPFYVAAPRSTLDLDLASGADIPIEERSVDEVLLIGGQRIAPIGASARHPAFDVTPARLITAIITDRGVARAPYQTSLAGLG